LTRLRIGLLTVSDRSARGERPDASGPALASAIQSMGWDVVRQSILPDEQDALRRTLASWADEHLVDVILTTGGTGFGPRDVTPEATLSVIEREAPGLPEAMRAASAADSPHAMLSRARAGIRGNVLIVNLPGSPDGAVQNLGIISPALEHAVQLLQSKPEAEAGHKKDVV
jgi:molybdopterin adenylyltransferase